MRNDLGYYGSGDIERDVQVLLWKGERASSILNNTYTSQPADLGDTVSKVSVSASKVSLTLDWSNEFTSCSDQPAYGDIIQVKTDGYTRMVAVVATIDSIEESRGTRRMSITARTYDGIAGWKDVKASSSLYSLGTGLQTIAKDVIERIMGMNLYEYSIPNVAYSVVHANVQLAEMSPWEMLEELYRASGHAPFVNGLGQISYYSREIVGRPSDVYINSGRVVSISGTRNSQGTDRVTLEWLDPNLSKEYQDDQMLYSTSMTSGFFKSKIEEDAWFSEDRSQRADSSYMKIIESVNAGLIPVADEDYEPKDEYHGTIILTNTYWVAGLATASIAALLVASQVPEPVSTTGVAPSGGGPVYSSGVTNPTTGRYATMIAETVMLVTMMSIGVGRYEVWGRPYDYVHAKNKTIVIADNASSYMRNVLELESDLIVNEQHAQTVAARELVYANLEANTWGAVIIDDPRIEFGDIVELEGYGRVFVTDWEIDLSRGAKAEMKLSGFRC